MTATLFRTAILSLVALSTGVSMAAAEAAPATQTPVPRIVVVAKRIPTLTGEVPRIVITAKRLAAVDSLAQAPSARTGRAG